MILCILRHKRSRFTERSESTKVDAAWSENLINFDYGGDTRLTSNGSAVPLAIIRKINQSVGNGVSLV